MGNQNSSSFGHGALDHTQADQDQSNKVVIEYPNGDIYEGDVIQSHGSKTQESGQEDAKPDNSRNGLREGYGRFIGRDTANSRNYEYVGEWANNMRHGQGRCYYYNGDLYQG